MLSLMFVSGCDTFGDTFGESDTQGEEGQLGYVTGFFGGVSADEPRAAVIGRDILSSGGNAADAAVAMYFALAVTMPSSASLGGGGLCIVHDKDRAATEVLEFLAKAPANIPRTATRPSAVPGNPRGFFALHAKYGNLRWEVLLNPATQLARFGAPVSRATAADLAAVGDALSRDVEMIKVFGAPGGGLIREGETLQQVDLASVIGSMQAQGPGSFYSGPMASQLVGAVTEAGGSLSLDDLRSYRPIWRNTVKIKFGYQDIHVAQPPASAGMTAGVMMSLLDANGGFEGADEADRAHLLAETASRAYGDRGRWLLQDGSASLVAEELGDATRFAGDMADFDAGRHTKSADLKSRPVARPENPAATSFVAVDRHGNAVSCGLTMNNFFGTGRIAPGTGIVLATIPGDAGRGPWSLTPMLVVNPITQHTFWASGASGGVAAATASVNVMARAMLAGEGLRDATRAKRVHHGGLPDTTYVEQGIGDTVISSLRARGHDVVEAPQIGRVNAFYCAEGVPNRPDLCEVQSDPRGFGLGMISEQ